MLPLATKVTFMKFVPSPASGLPATFVPDATPQAPREHAPYVRKGPKQPHDTIEGCRESARLDSERAATMTGANARSKYEHSAASWTARADVLQQIDDSHRARLVREAAAASSAAARLLGSEPVRLASVPMMAG